MKNFIKNLKVYCTLLLAISYIGCEDDDVLLPQLEAVFTHTINQDSGVVTFINASTNATSYSWDFGDGNTSTEINPIKAYPTGTYTVVLTASNAAGASDTFEDVITIQIPEVLTIPITFDNPIVEYNATTFNGATFEIVENPDPSGANPEVSNVGAVTNSGAAFEGFFFDLGTPLDLTTDKSLSMKFWSQTPTSVLVKLEEGTGADVETSASHTGSGWEVIYFTFNSSASYSRLTTFVDGPGTTSGTFYLDDVTQLNSDNIPCTLTDLQVPIDFDCDGVDYATKIVGNVSFTVVDNPEQSGINNSNTKVGQITNVGSQFENAFFNLDVPVDFSVDKGIKLKLFSSQALPVLLKFEDGTDVNVENSQMHGGTGWEELTFELNSSATYNDMVLFIDGPGNASGVFYVDDIEQVSVSQGGPCVAETMQSLNAANFNLTFQNDPTSSIVSDGAGFAWIDNPDFDNSVNTSCKVGQINRTSAAQFANNQIDLDAKLDFNSNGGFKLKVWSPTANTSILLKLEELGNPGNFKEVFATTSANGAMQWEEVTFNFLPSDSNKFNKIVLFFELGTSTQQTYYIDDLSLFPTGGTGGVTPFSSLPANFENGEEFGAVFEPASVNGSIVSNSVAGGINTSANVYRFNKPAGTEFYGGMENVFSTPLNMITERTFKVKVYSTKPNVVFQFELQVRPNNGSIPNYSIQQTVANANQWVELTFDFGAVVPPTFDPSIYNAIVIIPDFNPANQPTSSSETYYIDDLDLQ